jgi:DNA-binding MarR family transcriptional regulator
MTTEPTEQQGNEAKERELGTMDVLKALRDSGLCRQRPAERLIMDAIVLRAKKGTWQAFPRLTKIAQDTGLHYQTVQRTVGQLIQRGLLTREQRRNTSNLYTIQVTQILSEALSVRAWRVESGVRVGWPDKPGCLTPLRKRKSKRTIPAQA